MSETKAAELRTYTYEELAGHDVYELAHSGWTGEVYWSEDSLYLTDDDDGLPMLLPLFYEGPIPDFRWAAPNCISLYDWAAVPGDRCLAHRRGPPGRVLLDSGHLSPPHKKSRRTRQTGRDSRSGPTAFSVFLGERVSPGQPVPHRCSNG